jgi:hypothetical protein
MKYNKSVVISFKRLRKIFCTCGYTGWTQRNKPICPECSKKADVNLVSKREVIVSSITKTEDEQKITFVYEPHFYNRPIYQKEPKTIDEIDFDFHPCYYEISLDKESGECSINDGKTTNPIGIRFSELTTLFQSFFMNVSRDIEKERIIIEAFLQARGIIDLKTEDFIGKAIYRMFLFLKHPSLQFLGTKFITAPSKAEVFPLIKKANGRIELIENLIGHKSKRILQLVPHDEIFNFMLVWGRHIKHPENLIHLIDAVGDFKDGEKNLNLGFEVDFLAGIHLIKSLHENKEEKIWIERLIKTCRYESGTLYEYTLNQFVEDIGRMYEDIIEFDPEYQVLFNGDIEKLHNNLSRDYQKVRTENIKIKYNKKEQKLAKKINENSILILAPNTHYLMDVGSKMDICVGSYHEMALNKDCSILVLEEEGEPKVCLELRGDNLMQAKMKYNKRLTGIYRSEILKWCLENQISYKHCDDL